MHKRSVARDIDYPLGAALQRLIEKRSRQRTNHGEENANVRRRSTIDSAPEAVLATDRLGRNSVMSRRRTGSSSTAVSSSTRSGAAVSCIASTACATGYRAQRGFTRTACCPSSRPTPGKCRRSAGTTVASTPDKHPYECSPRRSNTAPRRSAGSSRTASSNGGGGASGAELRRLHRGVVGLRRSSVAPLPGATTSFLSKRCPSGIFRRATDLLGAGK